MNDRGHTESNKKSRGNYKHGASFTKEYRIYRGMLTRCYNENDPAYPYYGGNGITLCEEWLGEDGFTNFLSSMGYCPEGKSLDRINSYGGYSPENCRWADKSMQSFNQRRSKLNTTGRTGVEVSYIRKDGTKLYRAYINVNNVNERLVTTTDFELAEFCRQEAELHYYGFIKE